MKNKTLKKVNVEHEIYENKDFQLSCNCQEHRLSSNLRRVRVGILSLYVYILHPS